MSNTINFTGTGGIIEGNLGAANVNVNLDAALDFDGTNDYVDLNYGNGVNAQAGFSVSAWIKKDSLGVNQMWIGSDTGSNQRFYIGVRSNYIAFGYADEGWVNAGQQITAGDWYHVCVTATSGAQKLYVNGVEITASAKTVSDAFTLASDLYVGRLATANNYNWDGKITDVKIFGDVLTAAEVQELASKINYDISVGSIDNLTRWFKSNAGSGTTITDDSGNSGTAADITGATWIYDQYSVDVYDNSTTTDGTFTVTQGKVEGKALTSLEYNIDNDFVVCGDGTTDDVVFGNNNFTMSAWVQLNSSVGSGSYNYIMAIGNSASGKQAGFGFYDTTERLFVSAYSSPIVYTDYVLPALDKWHHIAISYEGGSTDVVSFYVDGVLVETESIALDVEVGKIYIGANVGESSGLDGLIRDARIYDFALSADQMASLYSNTFNITPLHRWKLDDAIVGTSTPTAVDSGTGTTANGTLTNFSDLTSTYSGSGWKNGTLDLDGALTIAANGTLSAPRGNLDCHASFTDNGTFTHNSGEVIMRGAGQDIDGSSTTTFFNLTSENYIDVTKSINVEKKMKATGSNSWRFVNNQTITMGTATSAGEIETGTASAKGMRFTNVNKTYKFEAVNPELFPWVGTDGGAGWNMQAANNTVELKGCDMQFNFDTQGSGGTEAVTWKLTGDCEFDAVTVSSGDTLDLNGQRAELSGLLSGSGTIACGTNALVVADSVTTSSAPTSGNMNLIETGDGHTHTLTSNTVTNWLLNGGTIINSAHAKIADNIIVGTGKLDVGHNIASTTPVVNITTATGAELDGNTFTLPLSGDFTTSGGLIGKSALNLTGSEEVTGTDNLDEVATSNRVTVEAWFKATTDANYRAIFSRGTSWSTGNIYLYMNGNGNVQFSMNDLGATVTSTTAGLADGKWHHAAATYDQTNLKLYIDGKLEASAAYTDAINTQTNGFKIGDRSGANWEGQIGRVSIWDAALTEAQIREMLFYDFATADSEATIPDANCIGWWQFDEGTGTAVADSSTNNADGTLNSAAWAGAGTFTYGTSTLKMTGTNKNINFTGNQFFYNLTIATGGDSNTITLNEINGNNGNVLPQNILEVESGKLASTVNEYVQIGKTYGNLKVASGKGGIAFADLTRIYLFQNSQSGQKDFPHTDSADKDLTFQQMFMTSTSTTEWVMGGNMTFTTELEIGGGNTFNANGNTITAKLVDLNDGTFNLGAGSLQLTGTGGSDGFDTNAASVLIAGPGCTIGGDASGQKVNFKSRNGFQIVGDIDDLNVTNEELTVIGTVSNCTGDILQFTPGHDTTLSLETDTAEDRDIRLGGPSLDNANHLIPE